MFQKSAQSAGFIDASSGRFVKPSGSGPEQQPEKRKTSSGGNGGSSGDDFPPLDGLILALVKKLPPAGTTEWKAPDRIMWLQMIAMAFQMAYGQVEAIEIKSGSDRIPVRGIPRDAAEQPRLIAEIDIQRAANLRIRQHGENAEIDAARKADLVLDRGDHDGQLVWLKIKQAIAELQAPRRGLAH